MSNLNWVDNIIILIFLFSMVMGLVRGFVKEVIALLTLVAAFVVATMFASPLAAKFTSSSQVQSAVTSASSAIGVSTAQPVSYLALGISFILLFLGTLIIGGLINSIVSKAADLPGISFFNRILGAVFGLARGYLVVLVIIFLLQLTPVQQEIWWGQSKIVTAYQPAVQWLGTQVQPGYDSIKAKVGNTLQNVNPTGLLNP